MKVEKILIYSSMVLCLIGMLVLSVLGFSMQSNIQSLKSSIGDIDVQIAKIPVVSSNNALSNLKLNIDWSSPSGREIAKKIGGSARLSDIAAYLMTTGQRQVLTANDVKVLQLADAQLQVDSALNLAFGSMALQGFTSEVVNSDHGYVIRGLWHLDAPKGSEFAREFPLGGRSVLHAESIAMPVCKTNFKPIAIYAPMYKNGFKPAKATIVEEKGRWRFFLDSETPYEYRILVDTGCVEEKIDLNALVAPVSGAVSTAVSTALDTKE